MYYNYLKFEVDQVTTIPMVITLGFTGNVLSGQCQNNLNQRN